MSLSSGALDLAIGRSRDRLLALQRSDGAWAGENSSGPSSLAFTVLLKNYLGVLTRAEARAAGDALASLQLADGSFQRFPFAREGDLDITLICYAALVASGDEGAQRAAAQAKSFIDERRGFDRPQIDAALFLTMAGLRDPKRLPFLPLVHKWVPGFERIAIRWMASWVIIASNMMPALVRGLKDERKIARWTRHPIRRLERERIVRYLTERQNPGGDWFGILLCTVYAVATLYSLGVPASDPRIERALRYIDERLLHASPTGLRALPFSSEIWDTSWSICALLDAGVPASAPALRKGADYLLAQQANVPTPGELQNPRPGAARVGGWPWEAGNVLGVDNDDTGFALKALRRCADGGAAHPVLERGIRKGLTWLLDMQNDDGGWANWTRGHRTKKPGPLRPLALGKREYPLNWVDPSLEDLTARVLMTLGTFGFTKADPRVARALAFLESQATNEGSWWGRWYVNYLPATAFVVSACSAVGEDRNAPYVRRAVAWMSSRQNDDGGFGETVESYDDASLAGRGPSNATITSIVLAGLVDGGEATSDVAQRAASWLRRTQNASGEWEDAQPQICIFPGMKTFLHNDLYPLYLPLGALARFRSALHGPGFTADTST